MAHDMTMLYRVGLVTDTILSDERVGRLRTAVRRCAKQFGWTDAEARAVHEQARAWLQEANTARWEGKTRAAYNALVRRHHERIARKR